MLARRKTSPVLAWLSEASHTGRFPGASNVDALWQNLRDGVESISFFDDDELISSGISRSVLANPNYIKAKGVLQDGEMFDASFFGYSPAEALTTAGGNQNVSLRIFAITCSKRLWAALSCTRTVEAKSYSSEILRPSENMLASIDVSR